MSTSIYRTPQELADVFQVSAEFVKQKARSGEWPCSHLGERTIRFSADHIEAIKALIERKPAVVTRTQRRTETDRMRVLLKAQRSDPRA